MAKQGGRSSIQHLLDVGFKVRAEFGTAQMTLEEILEVQSRGLIELDRAADGYVDLFIDNQRIARGEVIAIGNHYGVRIAEIIESPRDRPSFGTLPVHPVRSADVHPPRFSDMIADEPEEDHDAAEPARVHDHSIANSYEFPSVEEIDASRERRRDDETTGPVDRNSDTYSPRRSVPPARRPSSE